MATYKVVPGPVGVQGDQCTGLFSAGSAKDTARAAGLVWNIIGEEATDGWVFHSMETTTVHNRCLGMFCATETEMKLLIFVRD